MEFTQLQRCGTSQEMEHSPKLMINDLPNELLVEIFDFYRRGNVDSYLWWSIKLEWFKLIHVCKRWRIVMFASSSRLDLCFVLSRHNGGNMKTIMSRHFPPLPIDIKYCFMTAKDIGRMLAALKRPNRIRGIALTGNAVHLDKLFEATKFPLPALESLELHRCGHTELEIPVTFLGGSYLQLRYLKLHRISLTSILRLLSPTTALTDLSLKFNTGLHLSHAMSLLASLQGMPCLRRLGLQISSRYINDRAQPSKPIDIVTLSKLECFHYFGYSILLDALVAGISAPSLRDVLFRLCDKTTYPLFHLPGFVDVIEKQYHSVRVLFEGNTVCLALVEHHDDSDLVQAFRLRLNRFPESIMHMSNVLSMKLSTAKEVILAFDAITGQLWEDVMPWRKFLQQFRSVRILRVEGANNFAIARALWQDHEEPVLTFLPVLEEIELCGNSTSTTGSQLASEMAAIQPFLSVRQQAGSPVKFFQSPGLDEWMFLNMRYPTRDFPWNVL